MGARVKKKEGSTMPTNPESVAKAEKILTDLKAEAQVAFEAEDVFLMGIFTQMIKLVSPVVTTAIERQHRESRAAINADHASLRKKAAAAREQERAEKKAREQG